MTIDSQYTTGYSSGGDSRLSAFGYGFLVWLTVLAAGFVALYVGFSWFTHHYAWAGHPAGSQTGLIGWMGFGAVVTVQLLAYALGKAAYRFAREELSPNALGTVLGFSGVGLTVIVVGGVILALAVIAFILYLACAFFAAALLLAVLKD
jgi:hypothetical protein